MTKHFIGSVAFGLTLLMLSGAAQAYRINVAGWKGGSYNSKTTGRFSHCVVSARYKRGDRLLMSINRKYVFSLGIADNRWNLRKGGKYEVTLQVDRGQRFRRIATAVSGKQLVIRINNRATFFKMIKRGKTLQVKANGLSRGYSLRGTGRALDAALRCVKRKLRSASNESFDAPRSVDQPRETVTRPRKPSNPLVRNKPREVRVRAGSVSSQKALIYTVNLLSGAGIGGYKLLEKNPFKKSGYQVAWQYSKGHLGALAVFKNQKSNFVDTQTSKLLGGDARTCKGQFASGFRKSDSTSKWSGRRLFTICSNATNGNDFAIHYSIGLQPSGVATIVATHLSAQGLASSEPDDSEQIDKAIYESAAFREIGK